jgi:hypothetical protein
VSWIAVDTRYLRVAHQATAADGQFEPNGQAIDPVLEGAEGLEVIFARLAFLEAVKDALGRLEKLEHVVVCWVAHWCGIEEPLDVSEGTPLLLTFKKSGYFVRRWTGCSSMLPRVMLPRALSLICMRTNAPKGPSGSRVASSMIFVTRLKRTTNG